MQAWLATGGAGRGIWYGELQSATGYLGLILVSMWDGALRGGGGGI